MSKYDTVLEELVKERQVFIDKDLIDDSKCEELRTQIIDFIEKNYKELTVENIIEGMTSIGAAPSILYDDNGNFAIGDSGMQNFPGLENDNWDFSGTWWLQKEDWKPTIREAIEVYMRRNDE